MLEFCRTVLKIQWLFLCLFLFASCATKKDDDASRLNRDKPALAELSRINEMIGSGQLLTQNEIGSLQKIREQYPSAPVVRQILQAALIRREDWQSAADLISQIPATERTAEDRKNLAKIYLKLGRYNDSLQTVQPLIEENAQDLDLISISSGALFYLGRYEEAGEQLDRVWTQILSAKKTDETTIRGMIWFYRKDYDKAIETLNKAIEFNPQNTAAYNGLIRVYTAQGNAAKAEETDAKLQKTFQDSATERNKKIRFVSETYNLQEAFKAKRFDEVITAAQKLIPEAEGANKIALYQYMANAYQALGKQPEAQNALNEAEKLKNKK